MRIVLFLWLGLCSCVGLPAVECGVDRIFSREYQHLVLGKRIGLITNQTGVTNTLETTVSVFERASRENQLKLSALFAPEHGLWGEEYAEKKIADGKTAAGVPIFSLHGRTRRPTEEMLTDLDVLVYDVQHVGVRVYTVEGTLLYAMEEAAKKKIPVVVLDRPNPLGGEYVDGPMVDEDQRSFVGHIDVAYCHGMTIGELASFFNDEYKIGCQLHVIPMRGWKRSLLYGQVGRPWIPTSPNIPEGTTPLFYPATGVLGQIPSFVSIGAGYSLPFKVVGAPWIDGKKLADFLNREGAPGVFFQRFCFKHFFGAYKGCGCDGVLLIVKDGRQYNPVRTLFWIMDGLKQLYPDRVKEALRDMSASTRALFDHVCGSGQVYEILERQKRPYWHLVRLHIERREAFKRVRKKHLFPEYE